MKRVDAVRDRYFVRDVPNYVEEFEWNTPFQLDLIRATREYFSTLGKKSEIRKNIKVSRQWTFITFCLLSARVYFWYLLLFKRLWIAVLLSAVTDYLCAVNIFHAACHFAVTNSTYSGCGKMERPAFFCLESCQELYTEKCGKIWDSYLSSKIILSQN